MKQLSARRRDTTERVAKATRRCLADAMQDDTYESWASNLTRDVYGQVEKKLDRRSGNNICVNVKSM